MSPHQYTLAVALHPYTELIPLTIEDAYLRNEDLQLIAAGHLYRLNYIQVKHALYRGERFIHAEDEHGSPLTEEDFGRDHLNL